MRKRNTNRLEEYHTGKTTDLRNVVAEIQKVDEETRDLGYVVEEVKKVGKKSYPDRRDNILICRLLFSSFFDKILWLLLIVGFVLTTFYVFRGNVFHGFYGFWSRVLRECGVLTIFAFLYFVCNYLYHCVIRTMLCVTKNQVYLERYYPFYRKETSIPLSHITGVSTANFFAIFRSVIIHRYHQVPIVFFTWNNRKFKNKVMELLGENGTISNYYDDTGLLSSRYSVFMRWFVAIFCMILIILGCIHFFGYFFSKERSLTGTYQYQKKSIVLKGNGSCILNINTHTQKAICTWSVLSDEEIVLEVNNGEIKVPYHENALLYGGAKYQKK